MYHVFILFPYSSQRHQRWSNSWSSHLDSSRCCGRIAARNHINEEEVSLKSVTSNIFMVPESIKFSHGTLHFI